MEIGLLFGVSCIFLGMTPFRDTYIVYTFSEESLQFGSIGSLLSIASLLDIYITYTFLEVGL